MTDTRRALLTALEDGPVSGPALAKRLDVSRAAVWKHVEALREEGFDVASTDAGYAVRAVPEFGGAAVAYGLEAPFRIEYHDSIPSTNARARELASAGETDVVVLADEQTGGRGRLDRAWDSPPGGIWMSVVVRPDRPPAHAPGYTIAAAVATAEACQAVGVPARIKWPNDVVVPRETEEGRGGDKLAGILTEMEGEADRVAWLVAGVGLNANVDPEVLPPGATSLAAEVGPVERRAVAQDVLEGFDDLRGDLEAALDRWREHADTLGRRVRVDTPSGTLEGRAVDVTFPGALVVETDAGRETVYAGDCEHLRRV